MASFTSSALQSLVLCGRPTIHSGNGLQPWFIPSQVDPIAHRPATANVVDDVAAEPEYIDFDLYECCNFVETLILSGMAAGSGT